MMMMMMMMTNAELKKCNQYHLLDSHYRRLNMPVTL